MFAATRARSNRSLTSKLEVERKFVPTPLLKKHATETSKIETIALPSTINNTHPVTLSRLPRKRIMDKYFDLNGQLERKGIWVRWRREQTTQHDGSDAAPGEGFWEAKVKQGGDFVNSQFFEVKGRDAVEDLMAGAGVCKSIFDLRFQLGFTADRVSWAVKTSGGEQGHDGAAAMTLVLDSMTASLEGHNGDHPKYMQHQVGELELEKTITTEANDAKDAELSARHQAVRVAEGDSMSKQLEELMAAHTEIFDGEGVPLGKLTAYIEQKKELAARAWKANASGRLANMAENKYERLFGGK